MVTPAQRREAIAHLIAGCQMSERRACRVAGVDDNGGLFADSLKLQAETVAHLVAARDEALGDLRETKTELEEERKKNRPANSPASQPADKPASAECKTVRAYRAKPSPSAWDWLP